MAGTGSNGNEKLPYGKWFVNSVGMKMVRIEPGSFIMGDDEGDLDESPRHKVTISSPFYMSAFEVTNAQYEEFDPGHRKLRGKLGFSKEDDEAVVFVSWHEAMLFCKWLSEKEGLPYRLPTEAEWEYAARAGTASAYSTGDQLPEMFHKNQMDSWYPDPENSKPGDVVPLTVGQAPPNPWGLYDMHGNVEEWCLDWYGPYEAEDQTDPVGREDGDFRVTRGGSHSTPVYYLRSANRSGTLPEDKHWLIGFRVVCGELPKTDPLSVPVPKRYQVNVSQTIPDTIYEGPDPEKPYFRGPLRYVKLEPTERGPFFRHNHVPAIVECPNGDLLAVWFTCRSETGREMAQVASRLRYGQEEWEEASIFWDPPDRNVTGAAFLVDSKGTIFHFSGLGTSATWGNLALVMRTSADNGATWSKARIIHPEHGLRNMPIASAFITDDGIMVVPCDAVTGGNGGTALHISHNGGKDWIDPGGTIAGIHAAVAQLKDGRLLAFGRGDNIDGRMPKSISCDMGKTWVYSASEFPPISGGQRAILRRLKEGPLFFASFADEIILKDADGKEYKGSGLFGALSFDEGETWPVKKLITDDGPGRTLNGGAWTGEFIMSFNTAEPKGYLTVVQARNGVIHLISSALHYSFNLKWLMTPPHRK